MRAHAREQTTPPDRIESKIVERNSIHNTSWDNPRLN